MRYLIVALFLLSCSPQQRLARLVKNHPELIKHDTAWKTIIIHTKEVHTDTFILAGATPDTIVIVKENLKIKYFNNGKTAYLSGACDTLAIQAKVPTSVTIINPVKEIHTVKWWEWLIYGATIALILILLIRK